MKLLDDPLIKFDIHFPIYNWYYPIPREYYPPERRDLAPVSLREFFRAGIPRRGALYVHIPFCETICTFCPFVRGRYENAETLDRYVDALIREIRTKARALAGENIDFRAVNFGGGTPSLLTPAHLERINEALREGFDLDRLEEFSFECEVKSTTPEKMEALRRIGVTRITCGVQTFNPAYRELFNLTPSPDEIRRALDLMRTVTDAVGVDMLYGLHGQGMQELLDDLRAAAGLGIRNINVFPINNLRIQPVLHKRYAERGMRPVRAADKFAMRILADDYLQLAGYRPCNGHSYIRGAALVPGRVVSGPEHYLYSSILNGLHDDVSVGLGSGSHSYTYRYISTNEPLRERYVEQWNAGADEVMAAAVSPAVAAGRSPIMFLPYNGYLPKAKIDAARLEPYLMPRLAELVDRGLVADTGDSYALTKVGWYWYVNVMLALHPDEIVSMALEFVRRIMDKAAEQGIVCDGDMRMNAS
ncbi:MAG: radical SAM protein [Lentisphaerae bacterium]|nr:radical SAM protein [Lentisphaerota bacterium]